MVYSNRKGERSYRRNEWGRESAEKKQKCGHSFKIFGYSNSF